MGEVLRNLSDALATTVETASPAVVRVEARRRLPASGIVWSADGIVVTAHHVVRRDEKISVGLPDGRAVPASLVGRDPTTDLAVLRAETTGLSAPAWMSADDLRVGHLVLALGRPGQTVQATLGIVSALGKGWRTSSGGQLDRYLQTDVVMYPGFSGGPLVDASGRVLGLNTSALMRGVSLVVPSATAGRVVETLLAHGQVRRGHLGIGIQPVRLPEALAQELGQETGLLLVQVKADSSADQGGLLLGDTIVTLDGKPVPHHDALVALLSGDRVGTSVPVRIVRAGQVQELQVVMLQRRSRCRSC
jgi:S1-C subfamily serine protease